MYLMAQSLSRLDIQGIEFGDIQKQNTKPRNYVPLTPPVLVQTGVGKVVEVSSEDVVLNLPKKQISILKALEERLLNVAVQKKIPWFDKELDNEFMKGRFQSSVSAEQATLKLRKHAEFQAFDIDREHIDVEDVETGSHAVAVFELSYISFARAKFGGVFFLKQLLKASPPPACMVNSDDSERSPDELPEDIDIIDDEL